MVEVKEVKLKLDFLYREIKEIVAPISKQGIELSHGEGHTLATEFQEEERPEIYTPSTAIIDGGWAEWELEIPEYVRNRLVDMTLRIETVRTHGMLHSPHKGKSATISMNGRLLDRIYLVKPHPHGEDYGVDSRRPTPIFHYIDKDNSKQTIRIGVDKDVVWDVDRVTLEPIISRREIKPEAAMIIGAIISAFIGAIVSFFI